MERIFKDVVFKVNHVVLKEQAVSVLFFQLIFFFRFLQILLNIFYKVEIKDDFSQTDETFRIDNVFQFVNFQFYVMQGQRNNGYIFMYAGIFAFFLLYLLALFLLTGSTFKQSKTDDVKDSMKLVIKALSFIMCLFLYILQIPMQTLLLQGYQCDEDNSEIIVLSSITCDSLEHKILMVASTFLLIVYLIFLLLESYIYTSNSFEEVVPWASFD